MLLLLIIVFALLIGLFYIYKYKIGGNAEHDAVNKLCNETGWVRCLQNEKLLCHPDDVELTQSETFIYDRNNISFNAINGIRIYYVRNCKKYYNQHKNTIKNIENLVLLGKYYNEHIENIDNKNIIININNIFVSLTYIYNNDIIKISFNGLTHLYEYFLNNKMIKSYTSIVELLVDINVQIDIFNLQMK